MLESCWLHTWTVSLFGSLSTVFPKENRTPTFWQILHSEWVRQNYPQSYQKIIHQSLFSSKAFVFMEINQEKKYFSGMLDKKCTFELLVQVQMFSVQVPAFVETHVGSQAYRMGCRNAIILGLMILINLLFLIIICWIKREDEHGKIARQVHKLLIPSAVWKGNKVSMLSGQLLQVRHCLQQLI